MITTLVRRVFPLVAVAVVLGAITRRIYADDPSLDMWFHLRIGQEFLAGWSIKNPGHLGAYDSAEWTPTQWLPQMVMATVEDFFGIAGVLWLTGATHIFLILTVYLLCRREAAPLPAALGTGMAFLAMSYGLSPRPQVVSYFFVVITVFAWLATERDGRPRWWLVAVAWAWAPVHGMWPLASIIGAVCVAGIALDRRYDRSRTTRLAIIPVLSAVVPLLTPVGLDLYRSVVLVGGRAEYFQEWGPTDFHQPFAIVLGAMLAIAAVHHARRRQSWLSTLLLLTAAGWAIYSMRTTPVAAAIAAPLVARAFQAAVPTGGRPGRGERLMVIGMGAAAATAMGFLAIARAEDPVVPSWTDQRLAALPDGARVLNDWATGPYFLWKHSDLSLVMHGYGDVFTDDEIERNNDITLVRPGWDQLVADVDADAAIVEADTALGYALRNDDRWAVVQEDDEFIFLVPTS